MNIQSPSARTLTIAAFVVFVAFVGASVPPVDERPRSVFPVLTDIASGRASTIDFARELPMRGRICFMDALKAVREPTRHDQQVLQAIAQSDTILGAVTVDLFDDSRSLDLPPNAAELRSLQEGFAILVGRYDGTTPGLPRITSWLLGNEVNRASPFPKAFVKPEHYAAVLALLSPIARSRGGKVLASFSWLDDDERDVVAYLRQMFAFDPAVFSLIDGYDLHLYGPSYVWPDPPYRHVATLPDAIERYLADKPHPAHISFASYEQGTWSGRPLTLYPGHQFQSESEQGGDWIRRLVVASHRGYSSVALMAQDSRTWRDTVISHIGLAHDGTFPNDGGVGCRKPGFYAVQRLSHRLSRMTAAFAIPMPPLQGRYRFAGPEGRAVEVVWFDGPGRVSMELAGLGPTVTGLVTPWLRSTSAPAAIGNEPVAVQAVLDVPALYPSIAKAIDAAAGAGGGVIRVAPGIFRERVVLKDGIELYGAGPELTTIEGTIEADGASGFVLAQLAVMLPERDVTAPMVLLRDASGIVGNVDFRGRGTAIRCEQGSPKIARCTFDGVTIGILCLEASPHVVNNAFAGCGTGVSCPVPAAASGTGSAPIVTNNVFALGDVGAALAGAGQSARLQSNVFFHVREPLRCSQLADVAVSYNDFWPILPSGQPCLGPSSPSLLSGQEPFAVGGLALRLYVNDVAAGYRQVRVVMPESGPASAQEVAEAINVQAPALGLAARVDAGRVVIGLRMSGPLSSLRADHRRMVLPPRQAAPALGLPAITIAGSGDNICAEPRFANAASCDFRLEPGSACAANGDPSPSQSNPDGSRNDMGMWGGPDGPAILPP